MRVRIITRLAIKGKAIPCLLRNSAIKVLAVNNPFITLSHVGGNQPAGSGLSNYMDGAENFSGLNCLII